jgi:hypothetical protein
MGSRAVSFARASAGWLGAGALVMVVLEQARTARADEPAPPATRVVFADLERSAAALAAELPKAVAALGPTEAGGKPVLKVGQAVKNESGDTSLDLELVHALLAAAAAREGSFRVLAPGAEPLALNGAAPAADALLQGVLSRERTGAGDDVRYTHTHAWQVVSRRGSKSLAQSETTVARAVEGEAPSRKGAGTGRLTAALVEPALEACVRAVNAWAGGARSAGVLIPGVDVTPPVVATTLSGDGKDVQKALVTRLTGAGVEARARGAATTEEQTLDELDGLGARGRGRKPGEGDGGGAKGAKRPRLGLRCFEENWIGAAGRFSAVIVVAFLTDADGVILASSVTRVPDR